jgi:hypothetical protein
MNVLNVEIGAEAAEFPERNIKNGIAFAVWLNAIGQKKSPLSFIGNL